MVNNRLLQKMFLRVCNWDTYTQGSYKVRSEFLIKPNIFPEQIKRREQCAIIYHVLDRLVPPSAVVSVNLHAEDGGKCRPTGSHQLRHSTL